MVIFFINSAKTGTHRLLKTSFTTHRTNLTVLFTTKPNTINQSNFGVQYDRNLEKLVNQYENEVIYNSTIASFYPKLSYKSKKKFQAFLETKEKRYNQERALNHRPFPLVLKHKLIDKNQRDSDEIAPIQETSQQVVNFPFDSVTKYSTHSITGCSNSQDSESNAENAEIRESNDLTEQLPKNWAADYDVFPDEEDTGEMQSWEMNYGTVDPKSAISKTPCGGCGALLHCKNSSLPGFIPSEIFKTAKLLRSVLCQRCHFLKTYDIALQARVSADDYPKILSVIKDKRALVILMVDLLDFPCSIWPNIINIIGQKRPIIIVGNKADLLPRDSRGYLSRVQEVLKSTINNSTIVGANIKHVALISAKTGFGVEELITKLYNLWQYKGDVYIVGCTNVGKSTLFNTLLQSDYCKIQAVDLIQRATTSRWPGTTLNLLKFPILRPSGWRMYVRTKRLKRQKQIEHLEEQLRMSRLRKTRNPEYAHLIAHVDRTFSLESPVTGIDPFSVNLTPSPGDKLIGINEKSKEFVHSKWCYDTPGVVQPDQVLHLLTSEELLLTIPKDPILPRTYMVYQNQSIFIAGLGRLDILGVENGLLRVTVFAANELPVTICDTNKADEVYVKFLGTELFKVPVGDEQRLEKWPGLMEHKNHYEFCGKDQNQSIADVLLSSAGWISIAPTKGCTCRVIAWTPEGRGIYTREPILPFAVTLKGKRIRDSPAYLSNKLFVPK